MFIVVTTVDFVLAKRLIVVKRLTTMIAIKRSCRLIPPDVTPDFGIRDSFRLVPVNSIAGHSLVCIRVRIGLFPLSNRSHNSLP